MKNNMLITALILSLVGANAYALFGRYGDDRPGLVGGALDVAEGTVDTAGDIAVGTGEAVTGRPYDYDDRYEGPRRRGLFRGRRYYNDDYDRDGRYNRRYRN